MVSKVSEYCASSSLSYYNLPFPWVTCHHKKLRAHRLADLLLELLNCCRKFPAVPALLLAVCKSNKICWDVLLL